MWSLKSDFACGMNIIIVVRYRLLLRPCTRGDIKKPFLINVLATLQHKTLTHKPSVNSTFNMYFRVHYFLRHPSISPCLTSRQWENCWFWSINLKFIFLRWKLFQKLVLKSSWDMKQIYNKKTWGFQVILKALYMGTESDVPWFSHILKFDISVHTWYIPLPTQSRKRVWDFSRHV